MALLMPDSLQIDSAGFSTGEKPKRLVMYSERVDRRKGYGVVVC